MTVAPRAFGGALAFPGFRWFFAAIVFHSLGYWVSDMGQRWLVQELTGSPFYVGLVGFFGNLPMFSFSLPAGVIADRVDRVRLIAISRGFGAVGTLSIALLVVSGAAQVWQFTCSNTITRMADRVVNNGSIAFSAPAQSITLLVIPKRAARSSIARRITLLREMPTTPAPTLFTGTSTALT